MRELNKVLDNNEQVLWEGTPKFWPYFLGSSIGITILALFWLVIMLPFFLVALISIFTGSLFGLAFLLFPPFWIGIALFIGLPLYQYLVHKHIYYAITDKRVIIQRGLIGRDFDSIDFDNIRNAHVNVGLFDKLFGDSGSLMISAGKMYILRNIENPYDVFKNFKELSHSVKTDIYYPNELRPKQNLGYKTKPKNSFKPKK